jgi:hypothetical protein
MQTRFESPSLRFGALIVLLFVVGLGHLFAPAEDANERVGPGIPLVFHPWDLFRHE